MTSLRRTEGLISTLLVTVLLAFPAGAWASPHQQSVTAPEAPVQQKSEKQTAQPAEQTPPQAPTQQPGTQTPSPAPTPLGTAAAPDTRPDGVPASTPSGAAIAPAKQKRIRRFTLRTALLVGGLVAVGIVAGVSAATPSRP